MTYDQLRHFADSYGLGAMVLAYLLLVCWACRPGQRRRHDRAARMIFAEDGETPARNRSDSHG